MVWQHLCVTDCYFVTLMFPVSACSTICTPFPQDQTFRNIRCFWQSEGKIYPLNAVSFKERSGYEMPRSSMIQRRYTHTHEEKLLWKDELMGCPLLRLILPFLPGTKDPHVSAAPFFLFLLPTNKQEMIYLIHNKRQHNNGKIYWFDPVL